MKKIPKQHCRLSYIVTNFHPKSRVQILVKTMTWLMFFNGMKTRQGLFYAEKLIHISLLAHVWHSRNTNINGNIIKHNLRTSMNEHTSL